MQPNFRMGDKPGTTSFRAKLKNRIAVVNRAIKILAFWVLATGSTGSAADNWEVLPNGIGPIKVGIKLSDLKNDLHLSYSIEFAQDSDQKTCFKPIFAINPALVS